MTTVTLDEAKLHLDELIEKAAAGEPFQITREGKPPVQLNATDPSLHSGKHRLGGLEHLGWKVPETFTRDGDDEIIAMFEESI